MQQDIQTAISRLERQTVGARNDEWWAWADLGQFYLLRGDFEAARRVYEQGRRTGPTSSEYRRHLDVLRELASALALRDRDPSRRLSAFIEELVSLYD
jgi:hypothetical protein